MDTNKISKLIKVLNKVADNCDKKFVTRNNKNKNKQIFFRDIILFSSNLIHSSSYSNTNANFKINYEKYISYQAFHKKRNLMNVNLIDTLNDSLIDFTYSGDKKIRYIGTDGSQINLDYNLHACGYKPSKYNTYCKGKINSLYDIDNKIPINYQLSKGYESETDILLKQLKYINKGDVLVLDRGYYSKRLINILDDKSIGYVFRMKSNSIFVKNMKSVDDTVYVNTKNSTIKARIINTKNRR